MFRLLFLILGAILMISVIRAVAGFVIRAIGSMMAGSSPSSSPGPPPPRPNVPVAGELRKDPVCGTYVSTATQLTRTAAGQTYYFCSPECRDKFA